MEEIITFMVTFNGGRWKPTVGKADLHRLERILTYDLPLRISDRYICYPPPPPVTKEEIKERKKKELEERDGFFCDPH